MENTGVTSLSMIDRSHELIAQADGMLGVLRAASSADAEFVGEEIAWVCIAVQEKLKELGVHVTGLHDAVCAARTAAA